MPEGEKLFEKRLDDLEVAVAGIKGKLASIDIESLSNLQEKMDEIEDLIMVEQVGILELKKMIEETKGTGIEAPEAAKGIEERLKKIENDIASVLEKKEEMRVTSGVEVEGIYKRMDELEGRINNVKGVTEELKKILEEKMKAGVEVGTGQGAEFILPRVEKIEEKVKLLENDLREGMLQKFSNVAKEKDVATVSMSLDDIEKISASVSNLSKEINEIRNEVFQKTTEIPALVKKIEESNQKLSSSVFSEIDALKKRMDALEAEYNNLSKQMKGVRPEDFAKTVEKTEAVSASIEERYRKELEELKSTISKIIRESKAPRVMDTQINELLEKIAFLESRLKVIEKNLDESVKVRPVILE